MDNCLTCAQVAQYLGVSVKTVRALIKRGHLVALKVLSEHRIEPEALEAYKRRFRTKLASPAVSPLLAPQKRQAS